MQSQRAAQTCVRSDAHQGCNNFAKGGSIAISKKIKRKGKTVGNVILIFRLRTHVCAAHAAIARHLVFLHLIGGGLIARLGARTPQVSPNLTVYTLLCMQSYAPSCEKGFKLIAPLIFTIDPQLLMGWRNDLVGI